jgi:O-antigen/teichoic acid export membrane protein
MTENKQGGINKVAGNAVWIIGGRVVQSLLGLVINMLTARYLGPSNYGLITYASSLVAFVVPIMQLGFNNVLVREIVNNPDEEGKVLGTSMALSLFSSFFCIIGLTSFVYALSSNETDTIMVCLLYSVILIFQALEHIQYWYQAKLISKYTSVIGLFAYLAVSAYKIYLLAAAKPVYWFALSNALDYAIISVSSIILYRRLGGHKLQFSWNVGKRMFSASRHYILSSMMITIFAQTDKIMIKMMIGETETGYYGAAAACAGLISFVYSAIIDSFRPSIFEGQKESEEIFKRRLTMLYSIIIYMSLAQSAVMTIFAGLIIHILYGEAYEPAISALRIIVWYTTFSYLGSVRNIWILAHEKQHLLWIINLSGALANVVLNSIMIPIIGINGAAIASLFTQIFTNVIIGYIIKEIRPNNKIMAEALNPRSLIDAIKRIKQR